MPTSPATNGELEAPRHTLHKGDADPIGLVGSVRRVQEWLTFHRQGVAINGTFDAATEEATRRFQSYVGQEETGEVNKDTWDALILPMKRAVRPITGEEVNNLTLGQVMVLVSKQHLAEHPLEIGGDNRGPWVRLYMGGADGIWAQWSAGFVSFIHSQACLACGFLGLVPREIWIPNLAKWAKSHNCFISDLKQVKVGSIFLSRGGAQGWNHCGVVIEVGEETFRTIEGNTNDDNSAAGYQVESRTRAAGTYDFLVIQ